MTKDVPPELETRIREARPRLNARRQRLIRSILDRSDETVFLSSREMARQYQVDAATIVRTIQALGYRRFSEFSADLRRHFVTRITPYAKMRAAVRGKRGLDDQVRESVVRDLENLQELRAGLDERGVRELARRIHRARRILVVGLDLAASLAWFLAYGLLPLGFDAEAPTGTSGHLLHKVGLLGPKDLLVAISFGPCLRETVEAVLRCRRRSVPTFGLTDAETTPLARHCDGFLVAPTSSPLFTRSYAAPMSLINAVLTACAHLMPRRALANLRRTEDEYRSGARRYQEPADPEVPPAR
ncbi:MAG TPA: MurR/RpiR family transcriptional regulator [Planctomycetota bacterium]|nr:MurR/RpiR family transcriptional regulator [Planctomycetota bacterium]